MQTKPKELVMTHYTASCRMLQRTIWGDMVYIGVLWRIMVDTGVKWRAKHRGFAPWDILRSERTLRLHSGCSSIEV